MIKATHIKKSLHMSAIEDREVKDKIEVGDHVYVAHLPYSITHGYIITMKTHDDKFIMNGVPISADHEAIYKSQNEAIDAMIRKLEAMKNE